LLFIPGKRLGSVRLKRESRNTLFLTTAAGRDILGRGETPKKEREYFLPNNGNVIL
jgi:hypothetical protein